MNNFFDQVWMENSVMNYFIVAGVILFAWILRRIISRYFAGLLFSLVHKIWKDVDKHSFTSLVIRPLGYFTAMLVTVVALYKLKFPADLDTAVYKYTVKQILQSIGALVLIISFISLLIRIIDFVALILEKKADLTPDQSDNQLIVFFKDFFKVIFVIVGMILVLRYAFGLNVGGLLTGLSIVGAAIALALRESLENLIASFIIFFDKPFVMGDLVKVQQVTGSVERIGLRSTRIRTDHKTYVTVPNKQMVDSILDNLSQRTQRRADLRLELEPDTPSEKIEVILEGIKNILKRKDIEEANVFFAEITSHTLLINSDYYTAPSSIAEFNQIKQEVNLASIKLLEANGVLIAGVISGYGNKNY